MLRLGTAILVSMSLATSIAQAQNSFEQMETLATVLAAEEFCGLTYDQCAIGDWMDKNTDPEDLSFLNTLAAMTQQSGLRLSSMSESSKTAHCRAITRTAEHFEFTQ